jgi:hypothetical protein
MRVEKIEYLRDMARQLAWMSANDPALSDFRYFLKIAADEADAKIASITTRSRRAAYRPASRDRAVYRPASRDRAALAPAANE